MPLRECLREIEGQRGFFQILLYLNEESEVLQSHLYNNKPKIAISNNSTATRAIALLKKYKLVVEKKMERSNARYYLLTSKGRTCAQLLTQLQESIEQ